jgi:hypothetical protein
MKSKLLSIGVVGIAITSAICAVLHGHREWLRAGIVLSICYVLWLIIRTWRLVRDPSRLGAVDQTICRWSGIVGPLPGSLLLGGLLALEHLGYDPEHYFFSSQWSWFFFQFLSEVGLIVSFTCLAMPPNGILLPPRWAWKLLNAPFFLLHIIYVAGAMTYGFGESHGPR